MKVTLIHAPNEREKMLFKRCALVTRGETEKPTYPPSSYMLRRLLRARHSPIRVLNFAFLIERIPSNTATHLCRHVHAVPFVSSLRNDRQDKLDGDKAPRDTPVDMIFYCNAEELMNLANKRLCSQAAKRTQWVVQKMCDAAANEMPEIREFLVPACVWHGGVCHELNGCGKAKEANNA